MMNTLLKLSAAALAILPVIANAQANPAFVEKSQIIGAGNVVQLFGLPTKDASGKIKYWNTTITLAIDASGKPSASSITTSAPPDKAKSTEFVTGAYSGSGGNCNLVKSPFAGRTQFDLTCTEASTSRQFTITWFTGLIKGHPWEVDLVNAQVDTLPYNDEYSWGKQVYASASTAMLGCYYVNNVVSARQVGNTLTIVNYGNDNVFNCQASFNLAN